MRLLGSRQIFRWLAPTLAAGAVLILGVFLVAAGLLPGKGAAVSHNSANAACTSKFSVAPTSGAAGTPFTVQGSAWPAGKSVGVYLVDPSHHVRPITLQVLTVPASGAWSANLTIPGSLTFHAVGDETTNGAATQTINQTVTPGSYLVYAAAGDAKSFETSSVCPVKFAVLAASGAASGGASGGAILHAPPSNSPAQPATSAASAATPWSGWAASFGGGAFATLLLILCAALVLLRPRILAFARTHRRTLAHNGRRIALAGVALSLALFMILVTLPPAARAGALQSSSAQATSTLYSDDFEADAIGAFPAGWSIEAGSAWSVQQNNGSHALTQTSSSTATLYGIYTGSPTWTDYTVSSSVQPGAGSTVNGTSIVAIEGRRQDVNNFYSLLIKNGNEWYLGYKLNGTWVTLASGNQTYNTSVWYNWTLTMTGSTISASINGTTLATATDSTFASGNIGLKTRNQSAFDNVVVTGPGSPTPTPTPTTSPTATATATATATTTATTTTTPSGAGSIHGHVTDAASGASIAGAHVSTVPTSASATTDGSGNYTLSNVSANTYDVVVTANGYNTNHVPGVVVTNGGSATANRTLTAIPGFTAMDTFTQPDQTGWNPSTDGNTWTDDASTYPGAVVMVQNNFGYVDTYTAANDRDEWFGASSSDQLVSGDFNVSQFGQDSFQHGARLLGRVQDGHNFIDFAINYATSTLQIWVNSNENWTLMDQVNVPAFQTGQWYHAQLLTVGTMSYGKVWAYNTADPGWQISGSQTSLTSGSGGVRSTYCDINWDNISVQAVTTITGTVKNTSGSAISGATVSDGTQSVTTDSSGRYTLIEPNTNATYTVKASASGHTSKSVSASTNSLQSTTLNFTLS